ncbi:unnamed protein product [Rotaria magnacalcarata]|uniref:Uncharacterized protein n=3 Tax=Rotaria magnacalcarata TaxID=392030 RepID=A0A816XV26_9BILA|nr:unnamed protein product [Rotaria magnacalcarata]CAF2258548.1 unnamed protein product [Rotaria magnacalcarata]CAF3795897.1 unnamed protein product [Rotaria magnacalcarata]CAF3959609.1 unnamed protein product [Rotaria magnacalcarata]
MLLNTRRSPTLVDTCDFNALKLRDHNTNINTRNYLSSKTPPPVSYRDLRTVATNRIPSNIVILSKRSSSPLSSTTSILQQRKTDYKKKQRQSGFDVYRSLVRSISHCSIAAERDISNDEMNRLANSVTIDRVPLLPSTGFFYPHNLSKLSKHDTNSSDKRRSCSKKQINNESLASSCCEPVESVQPVSPDMLDRITTTTNHHDDENNDQMSTTTMQNMLTCTPKACIRKQLHVYVPQISC